MNADAERLKGGSAEDQEQAAALALEAEEQKKKILAEEKDKINRLLAEQIRQKNLQAEYMRVEKELNHLLPMVNEANLAADEL